MTRALRVRVYNVLFGDAVLLCIPERDAEGRETTAHVLLDVGNALAGAGGDNAVFEPVLRNIAEELGGQPLDLYVMTHEHMDHIQGLLTGSRLGIEFRARHLWMTASSAGDPYYDRFPEARRKRRAALDAYASVTAFLARSAAAVPLGLEGLLAINNPRSSADCVDYIRGRGLDGAAPHYVHRGFDPAGRHPFNVAKVRLLAPEEDCSVYYGPLPPRTLGAVFDGTTPVSTDGVPIAPPAGVSAGHFFDLIAFRAGGMSANIRAIDKAANNSSVVIELEWNGWRLLFPGDAEEKSWELMERAGALRPVHFLKVSHHGSRNGTPRRQLDLVLPAEPGDARPRFAVVSTREGSYSGVPDPETLELVAGRAQLSDTRNLPLGGWYDVIFPEDGGSAAHSRPGPG